VSTVIAEWPAVSRIIAPAPGEVRIWTADLEPGASVIDRLVPLLSADERERAGRFHFRRDAMRWIAARSALREILGGCLDADPRALVFAYGD
jgi:4'-phosphopantetheinyl transferase